MRGKKHALGSSSGLATIYLGLGSNVGDRELNLERALEQLAEGVIIRVVSSLYETEPVGYKEQPRFLNAVCQALTKLSPPDLLNFAKGVEDHLGRMPSFPNAPRPIDIDILFYNDLIMETPQLTIPHPRLEERAFVLIPLAEIAPELVHLVSQRKIGELAERVEGREAVKPWVRKLKKPSAK